MLEIWIGTRKGAFVCRSRDRQRWQIEGPLFTGEEVHHVVQDPRQPHRYYAAAGNAWFGPHLHASSDAGKTWKLAENGLAMSGGEGESLKRIWHVAPGAADDPGAVYLGADPGALFRSPDNGESWHMVEGLTRHPTREKWQPGAGGMMVHSIQCLGGGRIIAGISAAGAFRSRDNGVTWEPHNGGVLAEFLPVKFPEVGQCVHKLLAHPRHRDALYQQNHCGIYRGTFDGVAWDDVSEGLPSRFGFALAVPAAEERTLFTVPTVSAAERFVPEGRLRVARSRDGGGTWQLLDNGLPQDHAYSLVLREAMTSDDRDPAGVYFGTSSGATFYTRDGGDSWQVLAEHLPPIYSVTCAVQ